MENEAGTSRPEAVNHHGFLFIRSGGERLVACMPCGLVNKAPLVALLAHTARPPRLTITGLARLLPVVPAVG